MNTYAYFGKVPQDFLGDGPYFYNPNMDAFYYRISITEDMFTLEDTVGRSVPMDRTDVKDLSTGVFIVSSIYEASDEADKLFNDRMDKLEALVTHFNSTE